MYRVALQNFEGPLDLLLFFIKREEVEIQDIPISKITDQFIEYLSLMEELDLEVASEFILMAGTLISIKAKMLLPRDESESDEIDESDPRYELIQSLLEYKRYKEMGEEFRNFETDASKSYPRGNFKPDEVTKPHNGEVLKDVTLIHLIAAIQDILMRKPGEEPVHNVEKFEISTEDAGKNLLYSLRKHGKSSFRDLCKSIRNRLEVVVTFLAVLELVKESQLELFISDDNRFDFYLDIPRVDADSLMTN